MNKYQCEYLVIFLICLRCLVAQQSAFKYVTRGRSTQFGSLLCSPRTYINISRVYGCTSVRVTSHCRFSGSDCNVEFPDDHQYYHLVVSKCNGRVSCTDLNAGSYEIRSCNTYYTTIKYQCLPAEQDDQGVHHTCQSGTTKTLTAPEGTVVSPGYPGGYYDNTDCTFHISAPINHKVEITFEMLHLEQYDWQHCYDYLEVYDGLDGKTPQFGTFCGDTLPGPITSTGNDLRISFHSDGTGSDTGFMFVWRFIETAVRYTCQSDITHNITADQGTAVSPGHPGKYYQNIDCAFLIRAPNTYKVEITFQMFDLEPDDQCGYDYLNVYDGLDYKAPRLGRLCGDTLPGQITSTDNGLLISFHSDKNYNYKGFVFIWRFIEMEPARANADTSSALDTTTPSSTSSRQPEQTTTPSSPSNKQPEQTTQTVLYITLPVVGLVVIVILISVTIIMVKKRRKARAVSQNEVPISYVRPQGQATNTLNFPPPSDTDKPELEDESQYEEPVTYDKPNNSPFSPSSQTKRPNESQYEEPVTYDEPRGQVNINSSPLSPSRQTERPELDESQYEVTYDEPRGQVNINNSSPTPLSRTERPEIEVDYENANSSPAAGDYEDIIHNEPYTSLQTRDIYLTVYDQPFPQAVYQNYNPHQIDPQSTNIEQGAHGK